MPERAEDIAREAFGKVGDVIAWIVLAIWLSAWIGLAGIGQFAGAPQLVELGLAVAGGSVALLFAARGGRRLLLRGRAGRSLLARAALERLALNRDAASVLGAFDHSYQRALELLATPALSAVSVEARHDLDRVREQLYELVSTEMRLRADTKKLRRLSPVSAVSSAIGDASERMLALHREADRIAGDAHRLVDRLDRVRQLAAGAAHAEEAQAGLARVLEDLDQTASAYEEIERERLASAEAHADRLLDARRKE